MPPGSYQFEEDVAAPLVEVGFNMLIPEGWTSFDLTGDTLAQRRAELNDSFDGSPEARAAMNDLLVQTRQFVTDAARSGLISASGVCEEYEDGLFLASVAVFAFHPPQGEDADPLRMVDHIHPKEQQRSENLWLRTLTVEIPSAGVCGRVQGIAEHDLTEDASVQMVVMHTAVNVPGSRVKLLVSCSSPNLPEVDGLLDLFDAITATLRFWEDV
ncbi:hypothetical protein [Salinactinospora qingdaonensis]|uniref:Uncharacterized protein n=1 Tax=Salinactinospora qingdaonensis TaxID=702744 RepID=A0ABP7F2T6_9ACTN